MPIDTQKKLIWLVQLRTVVAKHAVCRSLSDSFCSLLDWVHIYILFFLSRIFSLTLSLYFKSYRNCTNRCIVYNDLWINTQCTHTQFSSLRDREKERDWVSERNENLDCNWSLLIKRFVISVVTDDVKQSLVKNPEWMHVYMYMCTFSRQAAVKIKVRALNVCMCT